MARSRGLLREQVIDVLRVGLLFEHSRGLCSSASWYVIASGASAEDERVEKVASDTRNAKRRLMLY